MPSNLRRGSLDDFGVRVARTLALLEGWGLRIQRGRFSDYLGAIQRVLDKPLPTVVPPADSALLVEAVNQCHQLVDAVASLADSDRDRLMVRLRHAAHGSTLPQVGTANDKARDYLFELAAAAHFRGMTGARIELPAGEDSPDFVATLPTGERVIAECKRPGSGKKLEARLRDARHQLFKRRSGDEIGMIVIGVDRLSSTETPEVMQHASATQRRVSETLVAHLDEVRVLSEKMDPPLFPGASVVNLLFTYANVTHRSLTAQAHSRMANTSVESAKVIDLFESNMEEAAAWHGIPLALRPYN